MWLNWDADKVYFRGKHVKDFVASFQFRIVTAPFHHVGFADFWLADQLNSLATVLLDMEYMICFYAVDVDWHGKDSESEYFC